MADLKTRSRPPATYEADFHAWTREQAARLRDLRPNSIDWENVAEEIESLGKSQRREIRSRLVVLLAHLLKWAYQPDARSNSWRASIVEARMEISGELDDSPSLRRYPAEVLAQQYEVARLSASGDSGLDVDTFPTACPFTIEQILDPGFWPERPQP